MRPNTLADAVERIAAGSAWDVALAEFVDTFDLAKTDQDRYASIERKPLCPALPPPRFTRIFPGMRSSSSWNAVICSGSSLKNAAAACTDSPDAFM